MSCNQILAVLAGFVHHARVFLLGDEVGAYVRAHDRCARGAVIRKERWQYAIAATTLIVLIALVGLCFGFMWDAEPGVASLLAVAALALTGLTAYAAVETRRRWRRLERARLSARLDRRRKARAGH